MTEIHLGSHTLKSHGAKLANVHKYDWIILLVLGAIDITLNVIEPFHRFVGEEMMTDMKYPFHEDTIPMWAVPVCIYTYISYSQSLIFVWFPGFTFISWFPVSDLRNILADCYLSCLLLLQKGCL